MSRRRYTASILDDMRRHAPVMTITDYAALRSVEARSVRSAAHLYDIKFRKHVKCAHLLLDGEELDEHRRRAIYRHLDDMPVVEMRPYLRSQWNRGGKHRQAYRKFLLASLTAIKEKFCGIDRSMVENLVEDFED
jgi:hypothetical protein